MDDEDKRKEWENYTVSLVPAGYVWYCPACTYKNHVDKFTTMVTCANCGMEYSAEHDEDSE